MPVWMKVSVVLCAMLTGLVVFYAVWAWDKYGSWREAIELHVETPSGVVSSRNVREVSMSRTMAFPGPEAGGVSKYVRGEALALEVAPGKWLFWLLDDSYEQEIMGKPTFDDRDVAGYVADIRAAQSRPPKPLDPMRLGLVTFLDIDDPDSARFIENGNLEPFFGPGYRIASSTVEIADDPVTEGRVIGVLDWWMNRRHGPYNEMMYLKVPDESPVGYTDLSARRFWSLEYRQAMTKQWENTHTNP